MNTNFIGRKLTMVALGALVVSLTGCDLVGMYAKEAVISATSHRGWDTFTFKGQLPAEFGIDAIAFYGPNDRTNASCRAPSFEPGKTITRRYAQRYTAEIQAQPQDFSFEIPLSYYKGLCGMRLGRVKLEINVRYGNEKWQETYADGNFYIDRLPVANSANFNAKGELNITALCSLMFQESRLYFGIAKLMSCRGAGAGIPEKSLANKKINFKVEVNPEEKPSMRNRWIQSDRGWKPCMPTAKSDRCQSPPIFKEFKMYGETCTVYPNCREQL